MINLLADERKDDIRAARANVLLTRYIAILFTALVFLMAVLFVSYTVLQNTMNTAEARIQTNDVQADVYSGTKAEVDTLSSKLSETRSTLDQEVKYSKVLITLGQLMPEGTVIGSLDLNENSFNGAPVEVKAYAKTSEGATAIAEGLRNSPLIMQVNLQGTDAANGIEGYPVSVSLTITFSKEGAK